MKLLDPNDFYHKIFWDTNKEFEDLRALCLSEGNWLGNNYTRENLDLRFCNGYAVIFQKGTDEPLGMGGLFNAGKYPNNVGKHLHREYTFPKFRQKSFATFSSGMKVYHEHCIKPLEQLNPQFDSFFVSMQTRYKKDTKGYWNVLVKAFKEADPSWQEGNGYIQTCDAEVQKCYQNYVFRGNLDECKTIDGPTWEQLIEGD